jgi:uncharacterized protein (TIGR02145 family)
MKKFTIFTFAFFAALALQLNAQITLNLKTYLEGPFFSTQMTPFLNVLGYIPTGQPYNIAPWNYNGGESVAAIPNSNVIDWVLVELLQQEIVGEDTSFALVTRKAAFILNNGTIKDLDGTSILLFPGLSLTDFYVRIVHRNHLQITSAVPLTQSGDVYSYDFSTGPDQAMGGTHSLKQLATTFWGMIAGDGNADGQVDNLDKDDIWLSQDNFTGYYSGDYNMDSEVDDDDKIVKWEPNSGAGFDLSVTYPIFECGSSFIDTRDGQTYSAIQIGAQCWMAENLNIGTMIQSTNNMVNNNFIEKYCYGNNTTNCEVYGGLYQWNEMMQYISSPGVNGICPDGWHLPTDGEFCTLAHFIDPTVNCNPEGWSGTDVGIKMKSTSGWNGGGNGTNTSGFTALPAGGRYTAGDFNYLGSNASFWSSSVFSSNLAWRWLLGYMDVNLNRSLSDKSIAGFSVRCVKGEYLNQPPYVPSDPQPPNSALHQPMNTTLSWICTDPDNDPLTYDVFFGNSNPPLLVSSGQTEKTYNPGMLVDNITYFWKIVAHDSHNNLTEAPVWTFTTMQTLWQCADLLIDTRDNQTYTTVQIGTQCWMAENLNIGTMILGASGMANNGIIEKYCYNNNIANCDYYGGLYQWNEIMQYTTQQGTQGICPTGWHLPSDAELCTLTQSIDPTVDCNIEGWSGTDVGIKMKNITGWGSGGNGTNASGFTALPSGYRYYEDGHFASLGYLTYIWSSTEYYTIYARYRTLYYGYANIDHGFYYKDDGFNVRCVKN